VNVSDQRDPRIEAWLQREAPTGLDDVVIREITNRVRATPQRRRGWGPLFAAVGPILAGTVAVALLATFVMVVIPRGEDGRPIGSAGVGGSPTPEALQTEPPAPSGPSGPMSWTAFGLPDPRPEEIQGEIANDAVAGGPGFVAVGRSYPAGDPQALFDERQWTAAVWTSVDGATWDLAEDLESLSPADLRAVAAGPDGRLLAVGYPNDAVGPDEVAPTGVGMWHSADGIHWEAVPPLEADVHGFADVIGTNEGWLAAGQPDGVGPTIFTSTDLENWTVEPLASEEDEIDGLFGDASGRVLAYGCDHPIEDEWGLRAGCGAPTGWLRTDGGWEAVPLPILPAVGAVMDGRYVIIGQGEAGAESFSSVDGRTWEAGATLPGEAYVYSLTRTEQGLAAGGSVHAGNDRFLPAVWHSPDGLTWEPPEELPVEGSPQEPTVMAIIQTPSGLIGLGYAYYDKPVAQGWIRSRP